MVMRLPLTMVTVMVLMGVAVAMKDVDPCEQFAGHRCPSSPDLYLDIFQPACIKKAACYSCGAMYGISKDACDLAYLQNMKAACAAHYPPIPGALTRLLSTDRSSGNRSDCINIATNDLYKLSGLMGSALYLKSGHTKSSCVEAAAKSCLPLV